jgi:hypothetical protein
MRRSSEMFTGGGDPRSGDTMPRCPRTTSERSIALVRASRTGAQSRHNLWFLWNHRSKADYSMYRVALAMLDHGSG